MPGNVIKDLYIWVHADFKEIPNTVMWEWEDVITHISTDNTKALLRTNYYHKDGPRINYYQNIDGKLLQYLHEFAEKSLRERYKIWSSEHKMANQAFHPRIPCEINKLKELYGIENVNDIFLDNVYCYGFDPEDCVTDQVFYVNLNPISVNIAQNCGLYPNL